VRPHTIHRGSPGALSTLQQSVHPGQLSLTIAITIDASRQATRITIAPIQIRGMPRS
jgi:hypothetical protein